MADLVHTPEPPIRRPRRGGIRDVAEFRDGGSRLTIGGTLTWVGTGCELPTDTPSLCYPSGEPPTGEKYRGGVEEFNGFGPIFALAAGVECWIDGEDYDTAARASLESGEDRIIESKLQDWVTANLIADSASNVGDAIASAEDHADDEYVGQPVLLMNRRDAELAFESGALVRENGILVTGHGTPVAASGAFVSGQVTVIGAPTILTSGIIVNTTRALTTNKEFAIAERAYGILVDCEYMYGYTFSTP